jgi:hypothetical protein
VMAVGWFDLLGLGRKSRLVVPDVPGREYSVPISRPHAVVPDRKPQFAVPQNRPHGVAPEDDV